MATQLLIYQTAIPVSQGRHGDSFIDGRTNHSFSDKVNSVPLMAVEFPAAASEYPIVFAGAAGEMLPAAVLGIRNSENLFLSKDKVWDARYVPAFIRRYPFVFSKSPDGRQLLLCVDEAFPGFNREGRGQKLFGADGKPSPYLANVLKFVQEYQAQFQRSQAFCATLSELGLLEPMQAQVTLAAGGQLSLTGFMAVSRAKLKALPGDKLAELAANDALELIYLHLQSMRNFEALKDRLGAPAEAASGRSPGLAARARKGGKERADDSALRPAAVDQATAG